MAAEHGTFEHVYDATSLHLPFGEHIHLPSIGDWHLTKFMLLQVVAGLLTLFIFRGLAKRVASGLPVTGRWWNFWESLALFIRDEVVRPTIGEPHHADHDHHGARATHAMSDGAAEEGPAVYGHMQHAPGTDVHGVGQLGAVGDVELTLRAAAGGHGEVVAAGHPADKYLPFVWSVFFYILFCNLLGAIPFLGSPTGNLNVTGALALATFAFVIVSGSQVTGFVGFWKNLVPSIDLPPALKLLLVPMIWVIELGGLLIKHGVLAVRLFANIMAGHTVIAVFLSFIAAVAGSGVWWVVMPASIFGQVAIGLLELFVAFLQAYVFAFLATLFVSAAVHPH